MWKLIGLMLGGDGIPSRPKSIDQIGDEVGCVLLGGIGVVLCLLAAGITVAICCWVWT